MSEPVIHVAYATARKGGFHARARAYVLDSGGVRHSRAVCLDDTPELAMSGAVEFVRDLYRRDGMAAPRHVESHGRKAGAVVDGLLFGPGGVA